MCFRCWEEGPVARECPLADRPSGVAAALLLAGPTRVRDLFVEGRRVVRDGQIATLDLPRVIERQNQLARALAG